MKARLRFDQKNQYPRLREKINKNKNKSFRPEALDLIFYTLETEFSDFFDFSIAEKNLDSDYSKFIIECVSRLEETTQSDSIIMQFYTLIEPSEDKEDDKNKKQVKNKEKKAETIRSKIVNQYFFVPEKKEEQRAYYEKLICGVLPNPCHLTFIDMMRLAEDFDSRRRNYGLGSDGNLRHKMEHGWPPFVCHLRHLNKDILSKSGTFFINLSNNASRPKWAILKLKSYFCKEGPLVYCETPLSEYEKSCLNACISINEENYLGGDADLGASTGYLAWLYSKSDNFEEDYQQEFSVVLSAAIFQMSLNISSDTCAPPYEGVTLPAGWNDLAKKADQVILGRAMGYPWAMNDLAEAFKALSGPEKQNYAEDKSKEAYQLDRLKRSNFMYKFMKQAKFIDGDEEHLILSLPEPSTLKLNWCFDRELEASGGCSDYRTLPERWFEPYQHSVPLPSNDQLYHNQMIARIVISCFITSSKKRKLSISLPLQFRLTEFEKNMIIELMKVNAYLHEVEPLNGHPDLIEIRRNILPQLARNRLFLKSGYKPPKADDYWWRSNEFWFNYLCENPDLLNIVKNLDFKAIVRDMGLKGLQSLLEYIHGNQENIETQLASSGYPPFYGDCPLEELNDYIKLLTDHLSQKKYFPFSQLGVRYDSACKDVYIDFIRKLNESAQFDSLTLLSHSELNIQQVHESLKSLLNVVNETKSRIFIRIPWLDEYTNGLQAVRPELKALLRDYQFLNACIACNRREKAQEHWRQKLLALDLSSTESKSESHLEEKFSDQSQAGLRGQLKESLTKQNLANRSFPIDRQGGIELQMEHQQQAQRMVQVQLQVKSPPAKKGPDVLGNDKLVKYANIDALLKDYDRALKLSLSLADENTDSLQDFFIRMLNASTRVSTPHLISGMTLDAAKELLSAYRLAQKQSAHKEKHRFISGINPDEPPEHFYTVLSHSGERILCYRQDFSYVIPKNPLTLILTEAFQPAESWAGDFRQLNLGRYADQNESKSILNEKQTQDDLAVFAALQPGRSMNEILRSQAAIVYGEESLGESENLRNNVRDVEAKKIFETLLPKNPEAQKILYWCLHQQWLLNPNAYIALGQVYHLHGAYGLVFLLTKLKQIKSVLGPDFDGWACCFFTQYDNACHLMTDRAIQAMDEIVVCYQDNSAIGRKIQAWWNRISNVHVQSVGKERLEVIWQAFKVLRDMLNYYGLWDSMSGEEFDNINSQNMLIAIQYVTACLRSLRDKNQMLAYLNAIKMMKKVSYGDLYYAICHEDFKHISPDLKLSNFENGQPSYIPSLKSWDNWPDSLTPLYVKRTLASSSLSLEYNQALGLFKSAHGDLQPSTQRMVLMYVLHIMPPVESLECSPDLLDVLSKCLHRECHVGPHFINIKMSNEAVRVLQNYFSNDRHEQRIIDLLKCPVYSAVFLEALNVAEEKNASRIPIIDFFEEMTGENLDFMPLSLFSTCCKLFSYLGWWDLKKFKKLWKEIQANALDVQTEFEVLLQQMLSIRPDLIEVFQKKSDPDQLIECIQKMKADPWHSEQVRHELIKRWFANDQNAITTTDRYRKLINRDKPGLLASFGLHKERLWRFLEAHTVISTEKDAEKSLISLLQVFLQIQNKHTYLDDFEFVLQCLEESASNASNQYWSVSQLQQLLEVLVKDTMHGQQSNYPISLLKQALDDERFRPVDLYSVKDQFSDQVIQLLKLVSQGKYSHSEQCQLFRTAKSLDEGKSINELMGRAGDPMIRMSMLDYLERKSTEAVPQKLKHCQQLLAYPMDKKVMQHWLLALAMNPDLSLWLQQQDDMAYLRVDIVGRTALRQGHKSDLMQQHELNVKAAKLLIKLRQYNKSQLELIRSYCLKEPIPTAGDLLRCIKISERTKKPLNEVLDAWAKHPYFRPRLDHTTTVEARKQDVERIIKNSWIGGQGLTEAQQQRMMKILESLRNYEMQYSKLRTDELAQKFYSYSTDFDPENDEQRAQRLAVLCEMMGRSTRKYPHLAQQYALILREIAPALANRIMKVATGEGKSHLIAMIAALHVADGKKVDICTATPDLAERDESDFRDFYKNLGIKACYITARSSHDNYRKNQIRIGTMSQFSHYWDIQVDQGTPIPAEPEQTVGLMDEFHYVYFEEGEQSTLNLAKQSTTTPKQMQWFYDALLDFYDSNQPEIINFEVLIKLSGFLIEKADSDAGKQAYLAKLFAQPLDLIEVLQSVNTVYCKLTQDVQYTTLTDQVAIGEDQYTVKEIIPLSTEATKARGSTFTARVHQLLAVKLNRKAQLDGKPENFHVRPESQIVSAQRVQERVRTRWGRWEGFSGTLSSMQEAALQDTVVLDIPTNQPDLREWKQPIFFQNETARRQALIEKIRDCIDRKASVLIATLNDAESNELKQVLAAEFKDDIICYTNDQTETQEQLFKRKREKEQWKNGRKGRGVILLTAGLGIGANPEVDEVCVMNARYSNDLIQKAGRSARNGLYGIVQQYHNISQLRNEEDQLRNIVRKYLTIEQARQELEKLNKIVTSIYPSKHETPVALSEDELCLQRVLYLREYTAKLINFADNHYRALVAAFSTWATDIGGNLEKQELRQAWQQNCARYLKIFEQQWLDIHSQDTDCAEQLDKIKSLIENAAKALSQDKEKISPLQLPKMNGVSHSSVKLVIGPQNTAATPMPSIFSENRRRYLARAQALQAFVTDQKGEAPGFLEQMNRVMDYYFEMKDEQTFSQLLDLTELYWNLDGGALGHQEQLRLLWKQMSASTQKQLADSKPYIEEAFKHSGKRPLMRLRYYFSASVNGVKPKIAWELAEWADKIRKRHPFFCANANDLTDTLRVLGDLIKDYSDEEIRTFFQDYSVYLDRCGKEATAEIYQKYIVIAGNLGLHSELMNEFNQYLKSASRVNFHLVCLLLGDDDLGEIEKINLIKIAQSIQEDDADDRWMKQYKLVKVAYLFICLLLHADKNKILSASRKIFELNEEERNKFLEFLQLQSNQDLLSSMFPRVDIFQKHVVYHITNLINFPDKLESLKLLSLLRCTNQKFIHSFFQDNNLSNLIQFLKELSPQSLANFEALNNVFIYAAVEWLMKVDQRSFVGNDLNLIWGWLFKNQNHSKLLDALKVLNLIEKTQKKQKLASIVWSSDRVKNLEDILIGGLEYDLVSKLLQEENFSLYLELYRNFTKLGESKAEYQTQFKRGSFAAIIKYISERPNLLLWKFFNQESGPSSRRIHFDLFAKLIQQTLPPDKICQRESKNLEDELVDVIQLINDFNLGDQVLIAEYSQQDIDALFQAALFFKKHPQLREQLFIVSNKSPFNEPIQRMRLIQGLVRSLSLDLESGNRILLSLLSIPDQRAGIRAHLLMQTAAITNIAQFQTVQKCLERENKAENHLHELVTDSLWLDYAYDCEAKIIPDFKEPSFIQVRFNDRPTLKTLLRLQMVVGGLTLYRNGSMVDLIEEFQKEPQAAAGLFSTKNIPLQNRRLTGEDCQLRVPFHLYNQFIEFVNLNAQELSVKVNSENTELRFAVNKLDPKISRNKIIINPVLGFAQSVDTTLTKRPTHKALLELLIAVKGIAKRIDLENSAASTANEKNVMTLSLDTSIEHLPKAVKPKLAVAVSIFLIVGGITSLALTGGASGPVSDCLLGLGIAGLSTGGLTSAGSALLFNKTKRSPASQLRKAARSLKKSGS